MILITASPLTFVVFYYYDKKLLNQSINGLLVLRLAITQTKLTTFSF